MSLEWYLAWYNLIFVVPFLLALLYLFAYAASGVTFGETEAGAEAEAEAETEFEAEAEVEAEAEFDAEAEVEAEAEIEAEAEVEAEAATFVGAGQSADAVVAFTPRLRRRTLARLTESAPLSAQILRYFGVGRVPLSVLLMVLFFAWGFLGVAVNALLLQHPGFASAPWQISVPAALVGTALIGRGASQFLVRWLPTTETYAREKASLVGRVGEAVFRIDQRFGMASVRDARGNHHQVACRVYENAPAIEQGMPVSLVAYDEEAKLYHAARRDNNS